MRQSSLGTEGRSFTIAIIGGGFTGAMLCVQLLRKVNSGISIALIERDALPGRGVAYGTKFEGHLLNVRAKNMSAYPDAPDHFVKWAQRNYSSSVKPDDFLPRPVYGQYVVSQLQEARELHPGKLHCIREEAVSLERIASLAEISLKNGETILAEKVVLALGHFPPGELSFLGETARGSRYVSNPWAPNLDAAANQGRSVLLIGTGLTSVDTAVELRARGFEGTIHMISRRGLLPQTHRGYVPLPAFWGSNSLRTARGLLREIRAQVKTAEANGADWRAVIDSLRPVTQEIWQSLPRVEQRRFLRHLRTYWDVHRHRIAERIGDQLALQLRSGEIQMHAGRITECREDGEGVEVSYRERKTGEISKLRVDRIVNCTGPESDYRRVASRLLSDLLDKNLVQPDKLSLGLDTDAEGALLDAQCNASDVLYTLGPLRKGSLWETIAVPELRVQVSELAELLLADCQTDDVEESPAGAGFSTSSYQ